MTVYRRGKGKTFYMNFTVNGQRVCRSTGVTSKRSAHAIEAAERQKVLKQSRLSPQEQRSQIRLLDAVDQVYEARYKYGKDSQRSYRRAINLAAIIGNIPLSEIAESKISHMTKSLELRGSSPATINRYLAALKTILRHHKQPVDCIKLRKEPRGRIRTLSREEELRVLTLLRSEQGDRRYYFRDIADLVILLLDTGLRLSEGLNISYRDINFDTGLLSIWQNKSDRPRSIPMTRRVRSMLECRQEENLTGPFSVKAHQAETAWKWVRKEMGLEGDKQFVLHHLRHTTASRMINAGVDLYTVKAVLGHASIQVTERYAHLDPSKLAHAISVLEL